MRRPTGGEAFAGLNERLRAVETFVNRFSGAALATGILEFLSREHEIWCGLVVPQIGPDANDSPPTRSQLIENLRTRYNRLLRDHQAAEEWLQGMVQQVRDRRELLVSDMRTGRPRARGSRARAGQPIVEAPRNQLDDSSI